MEPRIERNDDPRLALTLDPSRPYFPAEGELERRASYDPQGHYRAMVGGQVAGVASVVVWQGGLAWVYGMVVAPPHRGKGIGRALLRHAIEDAESRGARAIGLDATDAGRPLYESEGFRPVGIARRWQRAPGSEPRAIDGERTVSVYPISACEVMDIWSFDGPRFGANRVPLLASSMARYPERTFVAFDRASGKVRGVVFSQERWIGPLVADDDEAAARLLLAAERAGAPARAIAAPTQGRVEEILGAQGYEVEGFACTRMARGVLPGRLETQYLLSSWALG